MIGVEGGHAIGSSLGTLRMLARLGAGYLTLTHNDDTPWADSATGDHPHGGLTTFGEEVVRELNRCGVLVDLSHVSDDVMRQAIEVSEAPVIFSHSSARALCDVTRNVPDDVLEQLGRAGGRGDGDVRAVVRHGRGRRRERRGVGGGRRAARRARGRSRRARARRWTPGGDALEDVPATVGDVADHVDHVRDVAGIDAHRRRRATSTAPTAMPDGLDDVSGYPALFAELARAATPTTISERSRAATCSG